MPETSAAEGLVVQQWDDKFFLESLQENRFNSEMGTDESSIIQVREDLTGKDGKWITFALVNRLKNEARTGSQPLVGHEEEMRSRSQAVAVGLRRNATVVDMEQEQFSAIDLRKAGKTVLKEWSLKDTEGMILAALASVGSDNANPVAYGDASETERDGWLTNNADRVQFGKLRGNTVGGDHSASLGNIDNTDDKLTSKAVSLLKRMAIKADPQVRPLRSQDSGRRTWIGYAGTDLMRDLREDPVITQAQREVGLRMENERLFKGGDIFWDNIIIKEIDDMPVYEGVGAGGIAVAPFYLCGAQALGYAWSKRWSSRRRKEDDYGEKKGIGIRAMYGVEKLMFGTDDTTDTGAPKQHGIVTGYYAAEPDA